jgi:tetratricopeptide (TPR) repeat protein
MSDDLEAMAKKHFAKGEEAEDRGDLAAALRHFRAARAAWRNLNALLPEGVERREKLASCEHGVGRVLKELGRFDEALASFEASLCLCRLLLDEDPGEMRVYYFLARNHEMIGDTLQERSDLGGALRAYRDALVAWRRLPEKELSEMDYSGGLSDCLLTLGALLEQQGVDLAEALECFREAAWILEKETEKDPCNVLRLMWLATALAGMGRLLQGRRNMRGALEAFRRCVEVECRLAALEPDDTVHKVNLACTLERVGDQLAELGERDQTLQHYDQSIAIWRTLAEAECNSNIWSDDLAFALEAKGYQLEDLSTGLQCHRESLRIRQGLVARNPASTQSRHYLALSHENIGYTLRDLKDLAGAIKSFEQAAALYTDLLASDSEVQEWQRGLTRCQQMLEILRSLLMDDALSTSPTPPRSIH